MTSLTSFSPPFTANRSLHILLVTETWQPDVNGVAMSLYQLMSQLVEMGHQVSLVRPRRASEKQAEHTNITTAQTGFLTDAILTKQILVNGIAIPRYPDLQFGMPAYRHLKKHMAKLRPDIVHIATEGPLGLASLCVAKRLKIPATTGYHTQFHDFSKHFGLGILARPLMAYFKRFHNWSAATCVPSQKTQNDLHKLGFKHLYQVGRGVDNKRFHPKQRRDALRATWQRQHQQHTILMMVSRLSPEKGVDLVIQAFKALQSAQLHRAMTLVIVGDGPDRLRLEALAAQTSVDIVFTGAKTGDELAAHYASGDAFVFASQVETFGNVVTEAMASGLPVFAFDDAAAGLLVDEQCGQLAPMGDTQAFIDMVAALPKACHLQKMGQHAQQKVAEHSWQRPALQMLDMFAQQLPQTVDSPKQAKTSPVSSPLPTTVTTTTTPPQTSPIYNSNNSNKKSPKNNLTTDTLATESLSV